MIKKIKNNNNYYKKEEKIYTKEREKAADNTVKIGFINIAGTKYKTAEISEMINKERLDILGMAETWLRHNDTIRLPLIQRKDDTEIIKKIGCANLGRRGMAIAKNEKTRLSQWDSIDLPENFIGIRIGEIDIIFTYFPPREHTKYNVILKQVLKTVNSRYGVIVGDLNVRGHEPYNERLPTSEYNEIDTTFNEFGYVKQEYTNNDTPTFIHSVGTSTPDHVYIKNVSCKATINETTTISDHRLIEIILTTDKTVKSDNNNTIIRESLKPTERQANNKRLTEKYNRLVLDRFTKIVHENKIRIEDIDTLDNTLTASMKEAFKQTFKASTMLHKQKKDKTHNIPQHVQELIKTRQRLKTAYTKHKDVQILLKLRETQTKVKGFIKEYKKTLWQQSLKKLNNMSNTDMLKTVNKIYYRANNNEARRMPEDEVIKNILPGAVKIDELYTNTFQQPATDIPDITEQELTQTIQKLANSKAPGLTGITNELIKISNPKLLHVILTYMNKIVRSNIIPKSWNNALTIAIPKKDGGHRPITLLENFRKILEKILYHRTIDNIKISSHQLGFIKNKSTYNQVLNLELLIQRMKCNQLTLAFLDIRKAYDMADRNILWRNFDIYNSTENIKYKNILMNMIDHITTQVVINKKLTKQVYLKRGLVQGSVLSPILFNIIMLINETPNSIYSFVLLIMLLIL